MAVRAAKNMDHDQPELVVMSPSQQHEKVTNLLAEHLALKIKREQLLGEAKLYKNRMKEVLEEAESLARNCSTGQIRMELDLAIQSQGQDDDEDGPYMDKSAVRSISELRAVED